MVGTGRGVPQNSVAAVGRINRLTTPSIRSGGLCRLVMWHNNSSLVMENYYDEIFSDLAIGSPV
jgi:hypothetical protein